jgi:hypothetical protein
MPRSTRDIIEDLLATYDERLRTAFLAAVDDIRSAIVLRVVVERLEKGDVAGAIEAMHLDVDAFARLELAIVEAYNAGGAATVDNLPRVADPQGNRVVFRFGVRNPEAEAWLRDHSSTLVTRIIDDQREAIRTALTEGLAQGQNPRQTALGVVGRVSRTSNRREGGVIGLTAAQGQYVARARQELLSGEPDQLQRYLERGRRDKRFDRTILASIRNGKPIPRETVDRIVGRYADRLLELRGSMLAQNETADALAKSREDAIRQQIRAGKIAAVDVKKVWRHTPQEHPRHHHRAMNGKSVGLDEQFELPNGVRMSYPHAPDAPMSEKGGCKCFFTLRIDYFASVERRFRAEQV